MPFAGLPLDTMTMQEGDRVTHSTNGEGVILKCSGTRARVQYDDGGAISCAQIN